MMFKLAAVAAAVAATLALAACGGGGGDNGASFAPIGNIVVPPAPPAPPAPPEPPAPAPAPATNTFLYEQLPYPADTAGFLNDLNTEGAKGFMFLSPLGSGTSVAHVYVKNGDATYVYELKTPPADAGAFLSQANEAGSRGLRWVGAMSVGGTAPTTVMMYRKDSDVDATYTYRTEASATDKDAFLSQVNAQGAAGYFNTAPGYFFGGVNTAVFEKSSAGGATYAYELGDTTTDTNGALAQFEEKGARGFRYRFPYLLGGGFSGSVFVKDLSQSSTFNYQALSDEATLDADIAQSNAVGANGYGFVGPLIVGTELRNYYYKPNDCAGVVLCKPTNPFGL
jgi:hypothetical protein